MKDVIKNSFFNLLKPIIWFAIRKSFKFREFEEYAKLAFIKTAEEEMQRLGEVVTISKLSAMTGIQRRDVKRLYELDERKLQDRKDIDFFTKLIGCWQNHKNYSHKPGKPKVLSFKNREGEFVKLVSEISTDLNPYTVLFELERAGIAKNTEQGVSLIAPAYEPRENIKKSLSLLAEDSSDLYSAVYENVFLKEEVKNLHIKTTYDNIPPYYEKQIRLWFLEKGAKFHQETRGFLAKFDRDLNPSIKKKYPEKESIQAVIASFSLTTKKN